MSKRRENPPKKGSPAWMTTFGDLMNLLLCFFVMLFSMSTIDPVKYEELRKSFNSDYTSILSGGLSVLNNASSNDEVSVIDSDFSANGKSDDDVEKVENLEESIEKVEEQKERYAEKMYKEVSEMLNSQEIGEEVVKLEKDDEANYIMMTLSGSLLFDSGDVNLKEEAVPVLSKIGDILLMFAGYQIEIIGHTDNVPVTNSNHTYKDNNELSSDRALSAFYYLVNEKGINPSVLKYSGRGEYDPIASNATEKGKQANRRIEIKIYNELSQY